MTNTQLNHTYFIAQQLKSPLSLDIKIPFDSEIRTFDEIFYKLEDKKCLKTKKICKRKNRI